LSTFSDVWRKFQAFLRFNPSLIQNIINDRYESGNAFLIVITSLTSIYGALFVTTRFSNFLDVVFYGILDGAFAWIISSLGMWFILSRVFKENLDINSVSTLTGYAHGIVASISLIIFFQNYLNLSARIIEISILGIFLWLFYTISKTLEIGFFIEKRSSRIASSVFIIILIWTSGPLRIFF
tara:strand:+ start:369 stop:914 length:546 start_codon:yes stop_codon:yes gene_type:complete